MKAPARRAGRADYTILYNTIPYHTIPYYTILYYTILYYTILSKSETKSRPTSLRIKACRTERAHGQFSLTREGLRSRSHGSSQPEHVFHKFKARRGLAHGFKSCSGSSIPPCAYYIINIVITYMCVYMYMLYIHIHIHMCVYIYIYIHIHTYTYLSPRRPRC